MCMYATSPKGCLSPEAQPIAVNHSRSYISNSLELPVLSATWCLLMSPKAHFPAASCNTVHVQCCTMLTLLQSHDAVCCLGSDFRNAHFNRH